MSITVSQSPNRFNLVVQPNVWTLSGLTTEDGYSIIIRDQFNQNIASIRQPANPAGVAHFNISKILQAQMESHFHETTQQVTNTPGQAFTYSLSFGTYIDNNYTEAGTTDQFYVYNGYDDWRNLNWNDTPFNPDPDIQLCSGGVQPVVNVSYGVDDRFRYLTNYPNEAYPLRSSSYHTLGFLNRVKNWDDRTDWSLNIQPAFVRIRFYNIANTLIQTAIYSITQVNGLGPRPNFNSTTIPSYDSTELVGVVGAGPQNLKDAGYWPASANGIWNQIVYTWGNYSLIWNLASTSEIVDHYEVDIMSINQCVVDAVGPPTSENATELEQYLGDIIYNFKFKVEDPCSKFEPVTVSFMNQYGVKDYFTFDRRNTLSNNTSRQEYFKTNETWSASTFAIEQHSGGSTVFSSNIETTMELSSNWMDDNTSKWLEELYVSPNIQVYYDGEWHPAVITTRRYEQKSYSRDQLFQHRLQVKFANKKRTQRG